MNTIVLFYKYVPIENPEAIAAWQKELCAQLNLKGRIILATEGINGTVGGSLEAKSAYIEAMNNNPLFSGIDFKESEGSAENFPRMRISVKKEIVHLGIDPKELGPENGGTHLTPAQTHELLAQHAENLVLLDARNNYESKIGTFTGAITPDIRYFREFPAYVDSNLEQFKEKEVLMFCTGGIRCERASAYLKSKGVEKVYQVLGGIHRYAEQYPDGFFRGKNYVFDSRVALKVNDDVLGTCSLCDAPCDDYVNCLNASCNSHFISCAGCQERLTRCCSDACHQLLASGKVRKRPSFEKASM
jgi:predicted sulfurtransferase